MPTKPVDVVEADSSDVFALGQSLDCEDFVRYVSAAGDVLDVAFLLEGGCRKNAAGDELSDLRVVPSLHDRVEVRFLVAS
jgi:hypothetical protein